MHNSLDSIRSRACTTFPLNSEIAAAQGSKTTTRRWMGRSPNWARGSQPAIKYSKWTCTIRGRSVGVWKMDIVTRLPSDFGSWNTCPLASPRHLPRYFGHSKGIRMAGGLGLWDCHYSELCDAARWTHARNTQCYPSVSKGHFALPPQPWNVQWTYLRNMRRLPGPLSSLARCHIQNGFSRQLLSPGYPTITGCPVRILPYGSPSGGENIPVPRENHI